MFSNSEWKDLLTLWMNAISNKFNPLSKIFSSSDFHLMKTYHPVILSMHIADRKGNNAARNSLGSWNTKVPLFRLFFFLMALDEKCGSEVVWEIVYVDTSLRHHQCGILYWSDDTLKKAQKDTLRLLRRVHVNQVFTDFQKTNRKVHWKNLLGVGLFPMIF